MQCIVGVWKVELCVASSVVIDSLSVAGIALWVQLCVWLTPAT